MDSADNPALAAFGSYVKAQRQLLRVSQRRLAELTGVSDSYLSQVERGLFNPSPQVVSAIAKAFGIPPTVLYTQLGLIDDDHASAAQGVETAIRVDTRLSESQKEALIQVYRSYVGD